MEYIKLSIEKKIWGKFSRLFLFIFFWIALAIFWIIMSALD